MSLSFVFVGRAAAIHALLLVLSACASAPPQLSYTKAGVSAAQVERDSAACWNYALHSKKGQENARQVNDTRALGSLTGGPIAAAVVVAEQSANKDDPKKDLGNWWVQKDCMAEKGYKNDKQLW